jgi:pimeloyl-ACP methyl ester carboxylesterase
MNRMDGYSRKVILLHGLGRMRSSMQDIELAFRTHGYDTVNFPYPSLSTDITTAAHRLYEVVQMNADVASRVHFVTHSLGGIVVRRMLRLHGDERVGAIVMIAPPNNGAAMARFVTNLVNVLGPAGRELTDQDGLDSTCAVPSRDACVIAGTDGNDWRNPAAWLGSGLVLERPHDGTVSVEETRLPNATLFQVEACHTWIASHPETIRLAVDFVQAVCGQRRKESP